MAVLVAPLVFRAPRGAGLRRGRRPAHLLVLLVVPRVFRAPEGPAAREARRPHFVRRRASKPARALRSLRRPPHQWGRVADVQSCASCRSPARPRLRPRPPPPGPVGRLGRLSETGGTCARVYLRRIETAIAYAGEERAFVVHFSDAEAMPVSVAPSWGRTEASSVSKSPCFCVLRAKFFAPTSPAPVLDAARRARLAAVGVLHYTKPSRGVSAACRSLMSCNSPR